MFYFIPCLNLSENFLSINFALFEIKLNLPCEKKLKIKGYAKGEQEYNSLAIVDSEENENEIDEAEPEDYDSDRCSEDQFTCKNSDCISVNQRCDGTRHCRDGSDELNCAFNKSSGD